MNTESFEIESQTLFSESLIWKINRDFYEDKGLAAWSDGIVPHHMTSNSKVGLTYASLIFGFLRDLAAKGQDQETVYLLELGAGHGRLAFHILKHLDTMLEGTDEALPPYCYVLSDFVEENLLFFQNHPQFQYYFEKGTLDVSFFDAINSKDLYLRNAQNSVSPGNLNQPILAIANYFFDSIPTELFYVENKIVSACSVSISSPEDPKDMDETEMIQHMEYAYHNSVPESPIYENALLNEVLEDYRQALAKSYLHFPKNAITCMEFLATLSKAGLAVLTMDKGFHEIHDLQGRKEPELVAHGSFSMWVNYHALGSYCEKQGGKTMFPSYSNFHLEIACLLFMPDGESYVQTDAAYERNVNEFGPDDFNSVKHLAYFNVSRLKLKELLAFYRLSAYDAAIFIQMLPRLKQVMQRISFNERRRIAQTLDRVWDMYFNINEDFDLAYEIGGMLYDLAFYAEALPYFDHSNAAFGLKADVFYNRALCHYQLKQDDLFYATLKEGKAAFPDFALFEKLDGLDMT